MGNEVNWGILGTGTIAGKFAEGLGFSTGSRLLAVGSRAESSAEQFGERYGVPRHYDAYEKLVNDPDVDVVYIASPHVFHYEHSMLALRAGKAVLCEKPFTINAAEAGELILAARERGLFLMEAMWTRFFPLMLELREMIADGAIGEVDTFIADFGIRRSLETSERLFRLELGGGALLDLGIYLVSLASMFFGEPDRMTSLAELGETGVDERTGIILGFPGGAQASLYCSIHTETAKGAAIMGDKGNIRIHPYFHRPDRMTLTEPDGTETLIERPIEGNGMHYEAEEVVRSLRAGLTESPVMPLDESLAIMRTLDEIRKPWGLRYPADESRGS